MESQQPEYCTKLDEMKLDLIEKATANAKNRIDIMAAGTGARKASERQPGRVQITKLQFRSYSYDGVLDTSSRFKTAVITVRLNYSAQ